MTLDTYDLDDEVNFDPTSDSSTLSKVKDLVDEPWRGSPDEELPEDFDNVMWDEEEYGYSE